MMKGIQKETIRGRDPAWSCFLFVCLVFIILSVFIKEALAYDLALIEPQVLNHALSKWVILDARPKPLWQAGHLPKAHSFCWEEYSRENEKRIPYRIWPPERLAFALGKMGIDENTPVVVYGDADKSWGGVRVGHAGHSYGLGIRGRYVY
ncbi:MAG: rhodanese-like domain-containing protein [Thermodesulfobacteriota bacterium]|nr:rhodanese-like domain-containing protein [Thermodesulfobacteriota bacterium]